MTQKQERFCQEYIIDFNGARAAIAAGFSEKGAAVAGSRLLSDVNVQAEIQRLKQELQVSTKISAERVVTELAKIGFSNIQDFLEPGNNLIDLTSVDADKAAAIGSIKRVEVETEFGTRITTSFQLWDKVSALEKLGKHLGVFEADNNQKRPLIQVNIAD